MRFVLDTNIIVSALYRGGKPATILALAHHGEIQLVISPFLLDELKRTLQKERFHLTPALIQDYLRYVTRSAITLSPRFTLSLFRGKDEPDNRVLECAVAGGVQFIITGDDAILRLGTYQGITILKPAHFLQLLTAH